MAELFKEYKKIIKIAGIFFIVTFSIIYLRFFFQQGIIFDNVFLVKKESGEGKSYKGKSRWGNISIDVKGDYLKDHKVYLNYKLPNDLNLAYTAEFNFDQAQETYRVNILNEKRENIFDGFYNKRSDYYLFDESNEMVFPDVYTYSPEDKDQNPYKAGYEITSYNIVGLATGHNLETRGEGYPLFMAILLLTLTIIDIKKPLFFFNLETFLYVKDAEPSEFYLTMQKIGWFVFPTIAMILLLAAIN